MNAKGNNMKTKTKLYICLLLIAAASADKVSTLISAYMAGHNPLVIVLNRAAEVSK